MIVKHIPMRSAKRSSFAGLVHYITSSHGKNERVGAVRTSNMAAEDIAGAMLEAEATQARNTRAAGDKTYHLVVSFAPGEQPGPDVLEAVEAAVCDSIGFGSHQRVSAVHHDTDATHVHIAINKVDPRTFNLVEPYRAYRKLGAVAVELERRFGLQSTNHAARKSRGDNHADDMAQASGVEPLRDWIRRTCLEEMRGAESWGALHEAAARHGLTIEARGAGLIIGDASGVHIKPSTVARDLSKAALEARLGPFEAGAGEGGPVSRRYEPRPVPSRIDTAALYARYQVERGERVTMRRGSLAQARARRSEAIEAAMRRNRLERAAIKFAGKGARRLLYSLAARRLHEAMGEARAQFDRERSTVGAIARPVTWADWLQAEAMRGDAAALAALRARKRKREGKGPGFAIEGNAAAAVAVDFARVDTVTKGGTIIYHNAAAAVRDDGSRLSLSRGADDAAIGAAIRIAQARYGDELAVEGSAEFRARVAAVAAELHRASLARQYKESENGRGRSASSDRRAGGVRTKPPVARPGAIAAGTKQPDAGGLGAKPPAHRRDRVRTLSALDVVRFAERGQVLLPGDVPRNLEFARAQPDHGVRRAYDRPGVADPASQYVAERNAKRATIQDIREHIRYSGESGPLAWGGLRTFQGQQLALLQHGEAILVKPIDEDELAAVPKRVGRAVRIEDGRIVPGRVRRRTQ